MLLAPAVVERSLYGNWFWNQFACFVEALDDKAVDSRRPIERNGAGGAATVGAHSRMIWVLTIREIRLSLILAARKRALESRMNLSIRQSWLKQAPEEGPPS